MQSGTKDCGLFVMRYMKEIVQDKELEFAAKVRFSLWVFPLTYTLTRTVLNCMTYVKFWVIFQWMRRSNLVYTDDDINEIRCDFAKYFMKRHAI